MKLKIIAIFGIMLLIIGSSFQVIAYIDDTTKNNSLANTWTVDNEGDGDFLTIQDAIDDSGVLNGDIIEVYSGTYNEDIDVYKELIIEGIDSELLNGSDTGMPVIDANGQDHVIRISKFIDEIIENVEISGFIVQNSGMGNAGILIDYARNIKINDNILQINYFGVSIERVDTVIVVSNEIIDNNVGISIENSDNNDFVDNTISNSSEYGVRLERTQTTDVTQNTISNTGDIGIYLLRASANEITSNDFINNNNHATFLNCFNYWRGNSWDDNSFPTLIYIIWGSFRLFPDIPWLVIPIPQVDWNPV
jgi:parallel beta-helix repeat protein